MTDRLREKAREVFVLIVKLLEHQHGCILVNPTDAMPENIHAALLSARDEALEAAERAVRYSASLDENGYICTKAAAIENIRSLKSKVTP